MNSRGRGVFIGMSGFFGGALVAALVPWSPLPKAALVVVAAVLVSTTAWAVSHPRTAPLPALHHRILAFPVLDGAPL
ncbi:MAG: hypothetical protein WA746_32120 [Isosphaeraceae bacterium]